MSPDKPTREPIGMADRTPVFLDNNVWNSLAAASGPLAVGDLIASYRRGHLEVIGSTRIVNEIMLTAGREPAKYEVMRKQYRKLVGPRTLKDLSSLHIAEVRSGGRASPAGRYLSKSACRKMFEVMQSGAVAGEINDEVYAQKKQGETLYQEISADLRRAIEELGKKVGDFEPSVAPDDLRPVVFILVEAARKKFDLPAIELTELGLERVPSSWLHAAVLVVSLGRWIRDNAKPTESDQHDFWHAAAGAYFDILVTDDRRYQKALASIEWLPFKVMTKEEFALSLGLERP